MTGRIARSLNHLGVERFRAYLARLRDGSTSPPPTELLDDLGYSNELPVEIVMEPRRFNDRLTLGGYLSERFAQLRSEMTDRDPGLWAWASMLFFDQVCPIDEDGTRRPGQDYRHIPDFGYRHRHRHLLFGPYHVYRRHGVHSILLLSGPLNSESGLYHEIASRQDLIANKGVLEALLMLYFDPRRRRPKPAAQGSHRHPGTVRRLVHVLQQLDLTYDIYGLSGRQIIELLPDEFDEWKPAATLTLEVPVKSRDAPVPPPPLP